MTTTLNSKLLKIFETGDGVIILGSLNFIKNRVAREVDCPEGKKEMAILKSPSRIIS